MIREAVILAGGEGTRLRPVTYEIPKPLVPVQGRPILTWLVRWFARAGVTRVRVIAPRKWETVFFDWQRTLSQTIGLENPPRVDIWVEPEAMGTMGALVHELASSLGDEPLFVSNGDELKGLDLQTLASAHRVAKGRAPNLLGTLALREVPNPSAYGVAEMEGEFIRAFHEKPANPPSNLVNAGLYVIEPVAFRQVNSDARMLMFEKDLFPHAAASGALAGCALEGPWFDCGTLERWEAAIHGWKEPEFAQKPTLDADQKTG